MEIQIYHGNQIEINGIERLTGFVKINDIFSIFSQLNLNGNPRESKKNKVTDQIIDTLENRPDLFHFKSKGLLMGGQEFKYEDSTNLLSFELNNDDLADRASGIFDGGHNLFAIGCFILKKIGVNTNGINNWIALKEYWHDNEDKIYSSRNIIKHLDILIPLEVILPGDISREDFVEAVNQIREARNTNSQLPNEALENQDGKYEFLKQILPENINSKIRWKENSRGEIPVRQLISLAWVSLSLVDFSSIDFVPPRKTQSYSSKNVTSDKYSRLLEISEIAEKNQDSEIWEIYHPGVRSALEMLPALVEINDIIYRDFKNAYNKTGGKYNNISQVREDKSSPKEFTPYGLFEYNEKYPFEGYIWPIIYSSQALIRRDSISGRLSWISHPSEFFGNLENMSEIIRDIKGLYKLANFNPQTIGKEENYYSNALKTASFIALNNNLY